MTIPDHRLTALEEGYACAKTCLDAATEIRQLRDALKAADELRDALRKLVDSIDDNGIPSKDTDSLGELANAALEAYDGVRRAK